MTNQQSLAAFAQAVRFIPGGVDSPARAFGAVGGNPLFIDRAQGAYLWDIDGNRFIDYVGSWGPMILGHNHPAMVESVQKTLEKGTSFGAPTLLETRLAELVTEAIPSVEMVRFVNSGTEATMSAIRLARGFTGRDKIVKFSGNYHGHADSLLVAAGSAAATFGVPNSPGVTRGTSQDTLVLPYNDHEALLRLFETLGETIAAVIFEPVVGNMGCVLPTQPFLEALREVREVYGTLLICDEVMTGFRVRYHGAQSLFGIHPDLTTLGKIIGGGLPVGAYGGKREIMQQVMPAGPVYQAGTLSGNPLAMAAGIATLETLKKEDPYPYLEQISHQLADGIQNAAQKKNIPLCVNRVGSMMTFFFQPGPVFDWNTSAKSDTKRFATFFHGMLERGVYLPCSQFEAMFVSAKHTAEDIEKTIKAAETALAECSLK
ncbi:MAG: glutamate-1-semialdehyde 2,1-aminomutase [Planctomycetia bacterium]|nr:glutamate-1-semialdehyde 2,1-aminomutase [Planctomycetia bacterium]